MWLPAVDVDGSDLDSGSIYAYLTGHLSTVASEMLRVRSRPPSRKPTECTARQRLSDQVVLRCPHTANAAHSTLVHVSILRPTRDHEGVDADLIAGHRMHKASAFGSTGNAGLLDEISACRGGLSFFAAWVAGALVV